MVGERLSRSRLVGIPLVANDGIRTNCCHLCSDIPVRE